MLGGLTSGLVDTNSHLAFVSKDHEIRLEGHEEMHKLMRLQSDRSSEHITNKICELIAQKHKLESRQRQLDRKLCELELSQANQ
jgi:hypothetical protein